LAEAFGNLVNEGLAYPRPPDELWISLDVFRGVLTKGWRREHGVEMLDGPAAEAEIVDIRLIDRTVVVKYDRAVPEPLFRMFEIQHNVAEQPVVHDVQHVSPRMA
jgi:hypothetical protein